MGANKSKVGKLAFIDSAHVELEIKRNAFHDAREKYLIAKKELDEAIRRVNNVEFRGKYLKIGNDEPIYLFVEEQFKTKDDWTGNETEYWLLRGFGFRSAINDCRDSSYFTWDWWYEYKLYDDVTLDDAIKEITTITKEEFREAFNKQLELMKKDVDYIFNESGYFEEYGK